MTILEIIKKIEENNRQQKLNEDAMKNLREELTKRETRKNQLSIESQNLKRQQIKVEIVDVVKEFKKDWGTDFVKVSVDPIFMGSSPKFTTEAKCLADEMCNRARGTYLIFTFSSAEVGKKSIIVRPFNPDAIEKTGRKLRDLMVVEWIGEENQKAYFQLKLKEEEIKNYIFEGSVASFSSGDGVVVIQAGLSREMEEENEKYE